jgi:hypothetical protein
MFNSAKISKTFVLTLLLSVLLLSIVSPNIASVKAQGQASVTILDSLGGSTDPAAGTVNYNDGTVVTLTATPLAGYVFLSWQIATSTGSSVVSDNPTTLTVSGGVTYAIQPLFDAIQPIPGASASLFNTATDAVVGILAAAGGTTSPAPGTYYLADAKSFDLTAIPSSGWQFSHWVISGPNLSHGGYPYTATPTDNPYNVNHGYGNKYNYQAVFTPVGSTEPTPVGATPTPTGTMGGLTTETGIIIALVVVIVIILIAFGVFASRRKK